MPPSVPIAIEWSPPSTSGTSGLVGRLADEPRDALADLHDRREVAGRGIADVGRLGHRRADVAPVGDLAAELADARLELRVADRRRPHVDAAAPGPEIEPGADDRDGLALVRLLAHIE